MFASVRIGTMRLLSVFLLVCLGFAPATATEKLLHDFANTYTSGAYPVGQLCLSGGVFYGVTAYGINGNGNVFTMTTAGLVKTIHEFAGYPNDASYPNSGLVASGGNFYGTTYQGGASNLGAVYEITPTGTVTILHSFTGYNSTTPANSDGAYPYAGLLLGNDGRLYGTTYVGGTNNQGTVYVIDTSGSGTYGYTILHNFVSGSDLAYNPITGLAETTTGVLYGASYSYNASGYYGGLYKLNPDGTGYAPVHGFNSSDPNGYTPTSDLVKGYDGNLYGTCASGGAYGLGTVFKIVPGSTDTVTPLWAFDGYTGADPNFSNGSYDPQNRLTVGTDHNLYGVTRQGGAHGYGTAFKLTLAGVCTPVASFSDNDTLGTTNPLTQSGSTYYATSYWGGTNAFAGSVNGDGAAVSISGSTVKLIQSFYTRDGYNPYSSLVQVGTGTSAAFYGVTFYGGEYGGGAIFKITSTGAYKVIHHLNNYLQEGYQPAGGLLLGRDGSLYGTTTAGGRYNYGTIFKVSTSGTLSVIHHFQSIEGYYPTTALAQGAGKDNNLYGTCYYNGAGGAGSIFSTNTAGTTFTVLRYFDATGALGAYPSCTPVPDGLGNLYGTTYQGGANSLGTIFKVATNGSTFTTLFSFNYSSSSGTYPAGYYPYYSGPMVLNGGFLYGVAENGGANGNGVIFKCNVSTGATTAFHSFKNSSGEGYNPFGGLFYSSSNGSFYGATYQGGTGGYGVVYAVKATTGALTILHPFTGYNSTTPADSDGAYPYGGVILGTDGFLYGTTYQGGTDNEGSLFQQTP